MNIIENVLKQRLNRDITEIILTNIWRLKFDKIVDEIGKIEHRYNEGDYFFNNYNHIIEIQYIPIMLNVLLIVYALVKNIIQKYVIIQHIYKIFAITIL